LNDRPSTACHVEADLNALNTDDSCGIGTAVQVNDGTHHEFERRQYRDRWGNRACIFAEGLLKRCATPQVASVCQACEIWTWKLHGNIPWGMSLKKAEIDSPESNNAATPQVGMIVAG
jgi:hypothetical protein